MSGQVEQGVAVRAARVARRMTQSHLATAAGVSEKTVRRVESGDRVGPESIRAVCAVLDLDATMLVTEAECVPDAAAEARGRLADRERRAAFLVAVLTTSIAVTSACAVLDDAEIARVSYIAVAWVAMMGLVSVASSAVEAGSRDALVGSLRSSFGGMVDGLARPVAFARRAAGGRAGFLSAARVACLPPAVMATMHALKAMLADRGLGYDAAMGALVVASLAWWIAKATVRDASGLSSDGSEAAGA